MISCNLLVASSNVTLKDVANECIILSRGICKFIKSIKYACSLSNLLKLDTRLYLNLVTSFSSIKLNILEKHLINLDTEIFIFGNKY